jgi:C4-dicarboxylate-specific signal transduction histidine kinase
MTAATIEASRYSMSNSIAIFLARQQNMLIANSIDEIANLTKQSNLTQAFKDGLLELTEIANKNAIVLESLHSLQTTYQKFLTIDQTLLELLTSRITIKLALKEQIKLAETRLLKVHELLENINGKLLLENNNNVRQLKYTLRTSTLSDSEAGKNKFKASIGNYLLGQSSNTQNICIRLISEFYQLSSLMYGIIEETNADNLENINKNQLSQLLNLISNELTHLQSNVQDVPDLYHIVSDLNTLFVSISSQIKNTSVQNIVQLQSDLINKDIAMKKDIYDIQQSQKNMQTQFDLLNIIATNLKNNLLEEARLITIKNRLIVITVVVMILIAIITMGYLLMHTLTNVLSRLTNTMKKISTEDKNLSYRIQKTPYTDLNEVGLAFNTMAERLQFLYEHLQALVEEKTKKLDTANHELKMDIQERIKIKKEAEVLNSKFLVTARRAGMADVATSILHNIGNILNSVKVSLNVIHDNFKKPDFKNMTAVIEMIKNHLDDIVHFLSEDQKGKMVPNYLIALVKSIGTDITEVLSEIESMKTNVKHIEEVVGMQKLISGVSNISENVDLKTEIDSALKLSGVQSNENIRLEFNIQDNISIMTDRSKLLQILVNLLQNAKDSLLSPNCNIDNKIISIRIQKQTSSSGIEIVISDNGCGIEKSNIDKIFSFGFTTKPKGHGFGLYSSALAAKELGGMLHAISEGLKLGVVFILTLPLIVQSRRSQDVSGN